MKKLLDGVEHSTVNQQLTVQARRETWFQTIAELEKQAKAKSRKEGTEP